MPIKFKDYAEDSMTIEVASNPKVGLRFYAANGRSVFLDMDSVRFLHKEIGHFLNDFKSTEKITSYMGHLIDTPIRPSSL